MASLQAIARPYAQAAYEFAQAKNDLVAWDNFLETAVARVQLPAVSKVLGNSRITPQQWFLLFSELLSTSLNEDRKNFLRILTENRRLVALPEIALLLKNMKPFIIKKQKFK